MKRVIVKNTLGIETNAANFETVKLANDWIRAQAAHFPVNATFEIVDVTVDLEFVKRLSLRRKKRLFGTNLMDQIAVINENRNLSVEDTDAFMENVLITSLRNHLAAGNIETFAEKLTASDVSAFFTSEQKTMVLIQCQDFLTKLAAEG
jgi:hypothetical protein